MNPEMIGGPMVEGGYGTALGLLCIVTVLLVLAGWIIGRE